jgi:hypothetical protein
LVTTQRLRSAVGTRVIVKGNVVRGMVIRGKSLRGKVVRGNVVKGTDIVPKIS